MGRMVQRVGCGGVLASPQGFSDFSVEGGVCVCLPSHAESPPPFLRMLHASHRYHARGTLRVWWGQWVLGIVGLLRAVGRCFFPVPLPLLGGIPGDSGAVPRCVVPWECPLCSNCLSCKCAWCFFPWPLPLTQAMGMAFSTNVNNVGWLSVFPWLALLVVVVLYLRERSR